LSSTNSLGQLREEVNYIDHKMNGIYKLYWENGCELTNVNSKRENLLKTNSLGQLREEVNYIDDKMNGIYKKYDKNGQLLEEKDEEEEN
jgi:antitoxin component YwqK of YwqJK toxin-antitoxin module